MALFAMRKLVSFLQDTEKLIGIGVALAVAGLQFPHQGNDGNGASGLFGLIGIKSKWVGE